ncbi:Phage head-tail adaptor [Atlantibacter hermannii]|uniref:phage head closure protein n=1 Tax=Atlantibacter hermannii TaxID=565 RepID=UPI0028985D8B|nr:phage head closure protein [Atlantibacter hermannii]MEB7926120.1 phage head closure protein [Atlantibacter hermannii]
MSDEILQPGELNCRITLSYVETGRGPLGEPLPAEEFEAGKAWAKMELVSGRKVRTQDQQAVVETCQFTLYPRDDVQIDWKVSTRNRVYTVRNVDRSRRDRIVITGEADGRHDRNGN